MERLVFAPLCSLQGMFAAPQKLIQKRYDKLLDYCSRLERSSSVSSLSISSSSPSLVSDDQGMVRRDYEALNAQLVEELQRFNMAAYTILTNCVVYLVALLKGLMGEALHRAPSIQQLPVRPKTNPCAQIRLYRHQLKCMICFLVQAPLSNITEVQNSIMDELNNLAFVRDNTQKLMERKVSFERQRDKKMMVTLIQRNGIQMQGLRGSL